MNVRMTATGLVVMALLIALGSAHALEGSGGYEVTSSAPIATESDLGLLPEWSEFESFGLYVTPNGTGVGNDALAVDSLGRAYVLVEGYENFNDLTWYHGVVRVEADGTDAETVLQQDRVWVGSDASGWTSYGGIRAIDVAHVVVPSTGTLEERLVVVNTPYDPTLETQAYRIMAYELEAGTDGVFDGEMLTQWVTLEPDPGSPGDFRPAPSGNFHLATDGATGDLFVLEEIGTGSGWDNSIRRFSWSTASSAYVDEGAVTSTQTAFADLVFHAGKLYTFDASIQSAGSSAHTIRKVTPSGFDSYQDYAGIEAWVDPNSYHGMASDGSELFVAEWFRERRRGQSYTVGFISPAAQNSVTSSDNAVATYGSDRLFAMAGDGTLTVLMGDSGAGEPAIYQLAPSTGGGGDSGGGDSGGGGKGGGKGKKE